MKKFYSLFVFICLFGFAFGTEEVHEFKGKHLIASYGDCNIEALTDVEALEKIMLQAVTDCGATVLDSIKYVFPGNGMTMVIMLSESHASIHTYPEHGACFVDLFTCGDRCSHDKFNEALCAYLKPTEVNQKVLVRHQYIEDHK
jgi:S-adenosylmethionine decarboxylase